MHQERYAIVGYSFRLPGGIATADGFWQLLSERGFVRVPVADRYGPGYEPVGGESGPGRFGFGYEGLMRGDEPYLFDCHLFGMSAREASVMDPQLRMLLTCTWEAFERAGWDHARLRNSRTGVFVGAQVSASGNWRPLYGPNEFMVTGTSLDMLPNRISYAFNLTGPSVTYMTACSSGATALHAAVAALACGDCDQAVAGAASYLGGAQISAGFARLGVISPDGGCRSFDATANGYMRSEGVFVYLVKPLAAAEADGDRILAVIAGTAVNTAGAADGATGTGPGRMITAPTQHAQVALMRAACARAGLFPREVDYLEAHATGTRVGDRIEGNAIGQVFGGPDRKVPLRIASVKSNVGHMEAAAFGCALLKVLLMFERRTYAPVSRHFAVPNPDIDFTGLRVQTECEPFGEAPVVAGINSFGFGGANGHCLLTEYRPTRAPGYPASPAPDAACLVPLSARSPEALRETARELGELVAATVDASAPELDLYTLAGNLSTRRTHFATRTAFAATGLRDLAAQLDAFAGEAPAAAPAATIAAGRGEPQVLMAFAGQGTQWEGCGRELYATEPVFRDAVDAVDAAWRELAGFSLRGECFGAPQDRLDECQLAQPVIFMIEVALTELLRSWGVRPACVVGHSAGEVAAAYAAGIYTMEQATRLIFHRAAQQQRTAGSGRMLAIGLDRAGTEEILRELGAPTLEVACENAPASTVACGSAADVALAVALLEQRGIQHRLLRGNVAFHSRAMDVIEAGLRASLAFLDARPMTADVPFVSSVTGEVTEKLDAAYWWSNVRCPVRFAAAIDAAARDFRPDVVLEVAPDSALLPSVRQCLDGDAAPPACVPTLTRGADTRLSFHQALGALYREGVPLDFAARYPRVRPVSHLLPPHPRDERRMMDPAADDTFFLMRGEYSAGPLLGRRIPRRPAAFRGADEHRGLPVARRPPRAEHLDHAGGGLRRDGPAGARRRARALLACGVPQALRAGRRAGPAADRARAGTRAAGRVLVPHHILLLHRRRRERAALHGQGPPPARPAGRPGDRRPRPVTVHHGPVRQPQGVLRAAVGGHRGVLPVRAALPGHPGNAGGPAHEGTAPRPPHRRGALAGRQAGGVHVPARAAGRRPAGAAVLHDGVLRRLRGAAADGGVHRRPAAHFGPPGLPLRPAGRGGAARAGTAGHAARRAGRRIPGPVRRGHR